MKYSHPAPNPFLAIIRWHPNLLTLLAFLLGSIPCLAQPLPVRLFCDQAARGANFPIDLNTGAAPQWVRGDDLEFDVALGQNGSVYPNIGYLTNLSFQVFARQNDTNGPMMAATVYNTNFAALTQSSWNSGAGSHVVFLFTNGASSVSLGGAESQTYWLRIFGLSTNTPAKRITYLEGPATIYDGPVTNLVNVYPPNIALVVDALANLINPTNFFVENSNLLNVAVNNTHGAGGNVAAGLGLATVATGGSNIVSHPSETNQFTAFNTSRFVGKMRNGQRARLLIIGDSMSEAGFTYDSAPLMLSAMLRDWYGDGGEGIYGFDLSYGVPSLTRSPKPCGFFTGPVLFTNEQVRAVQSGPSLPDYYYLLKSGFSYPTNAYNSVGLFWLRWPQGGTFNLGVTNASGSTALATVGLGSYSASTNVAYTNFPASATGQLQTYYTGLTYTNFLLGTEFANTNTGVEVFFWSQGGIALTNLYSFGTNLLKGVFSNIAPDLVLFDHKNNGGSSDGGNIPIDDANLISCLPAGTPVCLTITPCASTGYAQMMSIDTNVIKFANANGYGLVDLDRAFPDYQWLWTNGYYVGDGVHPSLAGAREQALVYVRELNLHAEPALDMLPGAITSLTDNGVAGQFSISNGVLFVCVASNTWAQATGQAAAGSPGAGTNIVINGTTVSVSQNVLTNFQNQAVYLGAYTPTAVDNSGAARFTIWNANTGTAQRWIINAVGGFWTENANYNGEWFADNSNMPSFCINLADGSGFNQIQTRYAAAAWGNATAPGLTWTALKLIDAAGNSSWQFYLTNNAGPLTNYNATNLVGQFPAPVVTNKFPPPYYVGPFAPIGGIDSSGYTMMGISQTNLTTQDRIVKGPNGAFYTHNAGFNGGTWLADDTNDSSYAIYLSDFYGGIEARYCPANYNNGKAALGGISWQQETIVNTNGGSDYLFGTVGGSGHDGSLLTNLNAATLASGTVSSSVLPVSLQFAASRNATNINNNWTVAADGSASLNTNLTVHGTNVATLSYTGALTATNQIQAFNFATQNSSGSYYINSAGTLGTSVNADLLLDPTLGNGIVDIGQSNGTAGKYPFRFDESTGNFYGKGTNEISEINITNGVTLGGVRRTSWPGSSSAPTIFATTNINLSDGNSFSVSIPHHLGYMPTNGWALWLVCSTNDSASGLTAGQRIPASNVIYTQTGAPVFNLDADAASVHVGYTGISDSRVNLSYRANAAAAVTTMNNFQLQAVIW